MVNIIDSIGDFNHRYSTNVKGYKHDLALHAYYSGDNLPYIHNIMNPCTANIVTVAIVIIRAIKTLRNTKLILQHLSGMYEY